MFRDTRLPVELGPDVVMVERLRELDGELVTPTAGLEVVRFRAGEASRSVIALPGHHSGVCAPVWREDRAAAFCAMDGALWSCDIVGATKRRVCTFRSVERSTWMCCHSDLVTVLMVRDVRGHRWASTLDFIDASSGCRRALDGIPGDAQPWAAAALPEGAILFSALRGRDQSPTDATVPLCRVDAGRRDAREVGRIPWHGRLVASSDGRTLFADEGRRAWIIDLATLDPRCVPMRSAALSPSGEFVAGYLDDDALCIRNVRSGSTRRLARSGSGRGLAVNEHHRPAWSACSRYLCTTIAVSPMRAWNVIFDLRAGQVWCEPGAWRLPVWAPGFTPSSRRPAASHPDHTPA